VIIDEAEEFIPDLAGGDVSDEIHLRDVINSFVASLTQEVRVVFVRRYWYMSSVKDIAKDYGMTESKVKITLMRTRNRFKEYLEGEGISI
ncbi:MAG: sigma-70 family RNA polymerase sigma factor, partial [Clostridia bacterium]|nr:sigma-70 family RNA polymerase sigma factor [Clostridia bacterium]